MVSDGHPFEPTQLIARATPVRTIGRGVAALFKVGSYDVIRGLVRAPGAWLTEARGPNREAVLLQLIHTHPAPSGRRSAFERKIAQQTADLLSREGMAVMAHGSATRDGGRRVLFWALPWPEGAERVQNAGLYIDGLGHLIDVATRLARRLDDRHDRGLLDPLLSEHTVLINPASVEVLGVPVVIPTSMVTDAMVPVRFAPEEEATEVPAPSGDLWRLGHTLTALSSAFETVPERLCSLLERMTRRDPSARPRDAGRVSSELDAIRVNLHRAPFRRAPRVFEPATPDELSRLAATHLAGLDARSMTSNEPATVDEPTDDGLEFAETTAPDQPIDVPAWAFFFDGQQFHRFIRQVQTDLDRRNIPFNVGTGVLQLASQDRTTIRYLGLTDLARSCHAQPEASWSETIRTDFDELLANTRDLTETRLMPLPVERTGADIVLRATTPKAQPRIDPAESARRRGPVASSVPAAGVVDVGVVPAKALVTASDDALRHRLWPAMGSLAATATALAFGVVIGAFGSRWLDPASDREAAPAVQATSANEVIVNAVPSTAVVVSERDGQILGPVPIVLQVPPEHQVAVLVTAKGYEPQRLVLPSRGSVSTELLRLPADADPCAMALPDGAEQAYEGVLADVGTEGQLVVIGAAVVRAKDGRGPKAGAWTIRCPRFGGRDHVILRRPPLGAARLSVTGPSGATVYLNDRNVGPVPLARTVEAAFTKVTLRRGDLAVSRWVPTDVPVAVDLRLPQ